MLWAVWFDCCVGGLYSSGLLSAMYRPPMLSVGKDILWYLLVPRVLSGFWRQTGCYESFFCSLIVGQCACVRARMLGLCVVPFQRLSVWVHISEHVAFSKGFCLLSQFISKSFSWMLKFSYCLLWWPAYVSLYLSSCPLFKHLFCCWAKFEL